MNMIEVHSDGTFNIQLDELNVIGEIDNGDVPTSVNAILRSVHRALLKAGAQMVHSEERDIWDKFEHVLKAGKVIDNPRGVLIPMAAIEVILTNKGALAEHANRAKI